MGKHTDNTCIQLRIILMIMSEIILHGRNIVYPTKVSTYPKRILPVKKQFMQVIIVQSFRMSAICFYHIDFFRSHIILRQPFIRSQQQMTGLPFNNSSYLKG